MQFLTGISELKRLFIKIYKGDTSGRLNDEWIDMPEPELRGGVEAFGSKGYPSYVRLETLHVCLAGTGAGHLCGGPDKSSGKRCQSIHIKYDGMGFILWMS